MAVEIKGEGYSWKQKIGEIEISIPLPPGITKRTPEFRCLIQTDEISIKYPDFRLSGKLFDVIDISESTWTIEDEEGINYLKVNLEKVNKVKVWPALFRSGEGSADILTIEEMKKDMVREHYNQKFPGFNFDGAKFEGMLPDNIFRRDDDLKDKMYDEATKIFHE
jgi:uncharacterized protein (DUF736 family)